MFGKFGAGFAKHARDTARRGFSSASSGARQDKDKEKGAFGKGIAFLSKNKQQLVNMIGMWIVFTYSIKNYQLKQAWDEREEELSKTEAELGNLRSLAIDEEWLEATEVKIRKARQGAGTLKAELSVRFEAPKAPTAADAVTAAMATQKKQEEELAEIARELGTVIGGGGAAGDKGRGRMM